MADIPAGPLKNIENAFGQTIPFYGLSFDKHGVCTSPESRNHLLTYIQNQSVSDVIVYSHGWNTDFPTAKGRYEAFLNGVSAMADTHPGMLRPGFKPVFVGLLWPGVVLLWPDERTPDIAADSVSEEDFSDVLSLLDSNLRTQIETTLTDGGRLDTDTTAAIAAQLAPTLAPADSVDDDGTPPSAEDLLETWRDLSSDKKSGSGTSGSSTSYGDGSGSTDDDIAVAGFLGFDPRMILRGATVWQMKDRAGVVGSNGVAETVSRLLGETAARIHVIGHSYGCKVMSSAVTKADHSRDIESMLLLQPAINHLAFAPDARDGVPGGYRPVLSRVTKPVMTTFSWHDFPLYRVFHRVVRRKSDLGELEIAGGVSRYAALGGYGPQNYAPGEVLGLRIPRAGDPYPTPADSVRLIGLDGAEGITGHADVNTPYVFWAALNQFA